MTPLGDYLPRKYVYILMHAQLGTRTHLTRTLSTIFPLSTSLVATKPSVLPTFPSFSNFHASGIYSCDTSQPLYFFFFSRWTLRAFRYFQQNCYISWFYIIFIVRLKHKIIIKIVCFFNYIHLSKLIRKKIYLSVILRRNTSYFRSCLSSCHFSTNFAEIWNCLRNF